MTRQSISLRHAFASNPTRFLTIPTPRPTAVARFPAETQPSRPSLFVPPAAAAEAHPLSDQFRRLGLHGMAHAIGQLEADPSAKTMPVGGWLSMLVEWEIAARKQRRIAGRLRSARLRYQAPMAELDYGAVRGFDDGLFHWLALGQWIADKENVVIDGPTGVGKTWLACALGEKACRDDRSVRYERMPELLDGLDCVRGTGRYARRMRALQSVDLLILDDWGIEPLGPAHRHDFLEIVEYRYGRGSTLIASQLAPEHWPEAIGDAAGAAVILDRLVPNAHRLQLKGDSLRPRSKTGRGPVVADDGTEQRPDRTTAK